MNLIGVTYNSEINRPQKPMTLSLIEGVCE